MKKYKNINHNKFSYEIHVFQQTHQKHTKTQMMIISRNKELKEEVSIILEDIVIKNSNKINVLGTIHNDSITWKNTMILGSKSILNQLKVINYTLSKIVKYMGKK